MTEATSTSETTQAPRQGIPIAVLRRYILGLLTGAVVVFTIAVYILVQGIFNNFGPAVAEDLNWKTIRGAQELASASDLGLAVGDRELVAKGFSDYQQSKDVVAIFAIDSSGKVVASYGESPEPVADLFRGGPGQVRAEADRLVAWASASIEGGEVGKVALVVSTQRLIESRNLLDRISWATALAGLFALLLGTLSVNAFTKAVADRDAKLAEYAHGLEAKVAQRTKELDARNRGMRLVLDNVEQGFITIGVDGQMAPERSAIVSTWFPGSEQLDHFGKFLERVDPSAAVWLEIGLDQLRDGSMPVDVTLDQLPKTLRSDGHTWHLRYLPIVDGETLTSLLVVATEVTVQLERERAEAEQREQTTVFQRISADRSGFEEFYADAEDLVRTIVDASESPEVEKRLIHTLKGNAGLFGIKSVAECCHALEDLLTERPLNADDRRGLAKTWEHVHQWVTALLGNGKKRNLEVPEVDYQHVLGLVEAGAPSSAVAKELRSWKLEPITERFDRLAEQARALSQRLGKEPVQVQLEGERVRLDAPVWRSFWSAFVHAIRNAVDHGIEDPATRLANNKPPQGTLVLSAQEGADGLRLTLRDDGRGIDWTKLEARASALGLDHDTTRDLVMALFSDGVSTKEEVSTVSGRGVGMGALREATEELGGSIQIKSEPGAGTTFEFHFPDSPELAHRKAH